MNDTLSWWENEGGEAYAKRNEPTVADIDKRVKALSRIFNSIRTPRSIFEVGCGPGANLMAIRRLLGESTQLYACEPNKFAREMAQKLCPFASISDGHASAINAADGTFDLVLTAGVLIHIPPEKLPLAMDEIIRVSSRYVVCIEYFAPECEAVRYYGEHRIWKNDFGRLYLEKGLWSLAHGFFWKPEGFDNVVYQLLEK
jgi:pseudaminic acid biosynthesis-associated methylase